MVPSPLDAAVVRRLAHGYYGEAGVAEGLDKIFTFSVSSSTCANSTSASSFTLFGAPWQHRDSDGSCAPLPRADAETLRAAQIVNDAAAVAPALLLRLERFVADATRATRAANADGGAASRAEAAHVSALLFNDQDDDSGSLLLTRARAREAAVSYARQLADAAHGPNIAMVPLGGGGGPAVFAVTTRAVRAGDELVWSYSTRWWLARLRRATRNAVVAAALALSASRGGGADDVDAMEIRALAAILIERDGAARGALRAPAAASAAVLAAERTAARACGYARACDIGALARFGAPDACTIEDEAWGIEGEDERRALDEFVWQRFVLARHGLEVRDVSPITASAASVVQRRTGEHARALSSPIDTRSHADQHTFLLTARPSTARCVAHIAT